MKIHITRNIKFRDNHFRNGAEVILSENDARSLITIGVAVGMDEGRGEADSETATEDIPTAIAVLPSPLPTEKPVKRKRAKRSK